VKLAALVALLPLAALTAQKSRSLQSDSIPRELVEALLGGPGTPRAPTIVVGELPPALSGKIYMPALARVLGGMTSGALSTAVYVSSMRPQAIRDEIRREQVKLGWKEMGDNPMMMMAMRRGGFADAPSGGTPLADGPTVPMNFCSGSTTLFVTIDPQNLVESKVTVRSFGDNGTCAFLAQQATISSSMFRDPYNSFRWPVLINPVGAHSTYGQCDQGSNGGGGGSAGQNQLMTNLTAEELFQHYDRQLADSGWKQTGDLIAGRTWERRDSAGRRQQVEVAIRSLTGTPCRELRMSTHVWY